VDVTYRFSGFSADPVRRLLFGPDGAPIALKPRVFDTLLYLIEHRGQLLQKQALLDAIWPHVVVEENNLNQAISTLRRVLGETRDEHRFIVTEPGRGYRFVAPVEAVHGESAMRGVPPSPAEVVPPPARVDASAQRPQPQRTTARLHGRLFVVSATALVLTVLFAAAGWIAQRAAAARWAREEAIPEVARLVDAGDYQAAFALAGEARKRAADDPLLERVTPLFTATFSVTTTPAAADVFVRAYDDADGEWQLLGRSPLASVQVPRDALRWRFEKAGYALAERATTALDDSLGGALIDVPLQLLGAATEDMVLVPGGRIGRVVSARQVAIRALDLAPYFIDRFEVTNADFKEFLDAGGYADARYWEGLTFVRNGVELPFEHALAHLVDSTGRPGPANWELGDYPEGQGRYPVTGVSRYEAAAYARFRGKQLPTVYHWAKVGRTDWEAGSSLVGLSVPLSNFGTTGPVAVGSRQAIGPYGTYDLHGNVREWVANGGGALGGWVLGGGFEDAVYEFSTATPTDPFTRSASVGFRLMRTNGDEPVTKDALAPVALRPVRDTSVTPVSDEIYELYRAQYTYVPGELDASEPETVETTDHWIKQRVVINTVNGERMAVYLFIPHDAPPKAQAVILFPGVDHFQARLPEEQVQPGQAAAPLDFLVRSRRVAVAPSFQGSYARFKKPYDSTDALRLRREWVDRRWDLGATLDYLATREDIDASKIGYVGRSMGAAHALPLVALEPRLKTAVLLGGGLPPDNAPPEIEPVNFAPRVTLPVLMVSGKYDPYFPVDGAQRQLYELLGTRPEDKRHYTLEGGHGSLPRAELVRLVLDWLDRYLGPVL
jgi:DNA-binding winged helix-turn-helix (wHTH) protein/formylglycine-generating enzyme required for sulfatase activity/dienelactone hydrolase